MMLFLRKSPLRQPAGYVAHQYGVTMATAPYQDQIAICHRARPHPGSECAEPCSLIRGIYFKSYFQSL